MENLRNKKLIKNYAINYGIDKNNGCIIGTIHTIINLKYFSIIKL
jgi:hypothetical protein